MKKVLVIYGTRPEAIKLAPLIATLKTNLNFKTLVLRTNQHQELLSGIWNLWGLVDDFELEDFESKDNISENFLEISEGILKEIRLIQPHLIIVQGDTYSALAGALAGFWNRIPVAHVEAGLRSGNPESPWPEEVSRILVDDVSTLRFAPTELSFQNLTANYGHNYLTGNTIIDSVEHLQSLLKSKPYLIKDFFDKHDLDIERPFTLFTQHRRESFGVKLDSIFETVAKYADHGNLVYFPVHMNPNVTWAATSLLRDSRNIKLLPPLNYLEMSILLTKCSFIISDSGGLQEEAPSYRKKIFITREITERPEVISSGWGLLIGGNIKILTTDGYKDFLRKKVVTQNPFGLPGVSKKMAQIIFEFLEGLK